MMANVVSIREAVKRTKADGIPVSECTLRQWIKMGEIPHRIAGRKKILIFYPNLVHYIKCDGGKTDEEIWYTNGLESDTMF